MGERKKFLALTQNEEDMARKMLYEFLSGERRGKMWEFRRDLDSDALIIMVKVHGGQLRWENAPVKGTKKS